MLRLETQTRFAEGVVGHVTSTFRTYYEPGYEQTRNSQAIVTFTPSKLIDEKVEK
jgi:hypothetical protein